MPTTASTMRRQQQALSIAVLRGDVGLLESMAMAGSGSWSTLIASTADKQEMTIIHRALHAEFLLVSQPGPLSALKSTPADLQRALDNRHKILRLLLSAEGSAARGCPIFDAAHYRLIQSMSLLLQSMSRDAALGCLAERDTYGQTLLHSAAQAKAPGIARRLLLGDDPASIAIVGEHIGVAIPLAGGHVSVRNLNMAIGADDLAAFLEHGSALGTAWLDSRDGRGLSPLHHACRAGRASAIDLLLKHGASGWLAEEESGALCGHLTAARGHREALAVWVDAMGVDALEAKDAFGRTVETLWENKIGPGASTSSASTSSASTSSAVDAGDADADAADGVIDSEDAGEASRAVVGGVCEAGWRTMARASLAGLSDAGARFAHPPVAQVPVVDARQLTRADFVERFESRGQPVLLSNATAAWAALASPSRRWTRSYLRTSEAGRLPVELSSMPYQPGVGGAARARPTLADFLESMLVEAGTDENSTRTPRGASQPPPFVFDGGRLLSTSLGEDVTPHPAVLRVDGLPGGVDGAVLQQLSVSPALAGAHPHFHGTAYNALVVGIRRWALVPPAHATFTLQPALEYFSTLRHGSADPRHRAALVGSEPLPPWLDVIQRPGDVLYVPSQWQHATISLAESVAVAVEYN
jgi:hypothetical protein